MNKRVVSVSSLYISVALLGLVLYTPTPSDADSGWVALAYPVELIVVDGDLDDWPEALPWYDIPIVGEGRKPVDERDFSARFRVGYNVGENALYASVEVRDDSPVLGRNEDFDWRYFDSCQLYLQSPDSDSLHVYAAYGYDQVYRRDPSGGTRILNDDEFAPLRVRQRGNIRTYEFSTVVDWSLVPGQSAGFDVSIGDVDVDGSTSLMLWGGGATKRRTRAYMGDVVLVGSVLGEMRVRVVAHEEDAGLPAALRLRSIDSGDIDIHIRVDAQGHAQCQVPVGRYAINAVGRDSSRVIEVVVEPDQVAYFALDYRAGLGARKALGKGLVQPLGAGHLQGLWWTLDRTDGLRVGSVEALVRTRVGHLWFAAGSDGLARYDGSSLELYGTENGLPAFPLKHLLSSADQALWLGFYGGGLCRLDGGQLTCYTAHDGLPSDFVTALAEGVDGTLWVGTEAGLCRFDGSSFVAVGGGQLPNRDISSLFVERGGALWVGSTWGGIARFDGEHFSTYSIEHGLCSDDIHAIAQDSTGAMWFAGNGGEVSRFDGVQFANIQINRGLANPFISSLLCDRYGDLWIGTRRAGLARYSRGEIAFYGVREGLANRNIAALLQDGEGFLWVGAEGGHLSRSNQLRFRTYQAVVADSIVQTPFYAALTDAHGRMWFGGDQGLYYYDPAADKLLNAGLQRDVYGAGIMAMSEGEEGHLWLGSHYGGLLHYDSGIIDQYNIKDGMPHSEVYSVLPTSTGQVWLGTYGSGVSRFDGTRFYNYADLNGLVANGVVEALLEDRRGGIWLGTHNGLLRYEEGHFKLVYAAGSGVRALLEDREGHIWAGGSGLHHYDGVEWVSYSEADGLPDGAVQSLYEDRSGHLWVGTRSGVARFDGQVFRALTRRDGLAHDWVYGITQDRGGDMFFATGGGITRYRSGLVKPQVRISDVVAGRRLGAVDEVAIPLSQDYLSFEFSAHGFNTPRGDMIYRYRLLGYEEEWKHTLEERIDYAHLPYGDYAFEVVAIDRELNYSPQAARVRVRVHLPYEQMVAWGGGGLALVLGVVLVVGALGRRRRERQLLRDRNELLEDANERLREADQLKSDFVSHVSHELRTPLALIRGSVDNLLDGIIDERSEKRDRYLRRLRGNADHLTSMVDDLLDLSRIEAGYLALERGRLDMGQLARAVVDQLRPLAEEKGLEIACVVDGEVIVYGDGKRLHQVVGNLLGNAIKYTQQGGVVEVKVVREGEQVRTVISDDGPGIEAGELQAIFAKFYRGSGRPAGARGAGIGLALAQRLVEMHAGRIWAESEMGVGSAFTFVLPFCERQSELGD